MCADFLNMLHKQHNMKSIADLLQMGKSRKIGENFQRLLLQKKIAEHGRLCVVIESMVCSDRCSGYFRLNNILRSNIFSCRGCGVIGVDQHGISGQEIPYCGFV